MVNIIDINMSDKMLVNFGFKESSKRNSSSYKRFGIHVNRMIIRQKKWKKNRYGSYRQEVKTYISKELYNRSNWPDSKSGSRRNIWASPKDCGPNSASFHAKSEIDNNFYAELFYDKNVISQPNIMNGLRRGTYHPNYILATST